MSVKNIEQLKEEDMNLSDKIYIFDTTLRDGEQTPGVALTVDEKIQIAQKLNNLGVDKIEVGSKVYDDENKQALGEVVTVEKKPSVVYYPNAQGEVVVGSKDNFQSVIITAKVDGTLSDYGLEFGGIKYGVGHSMTLRAGYAKIYLKVYDIYAEAMFGIIIVY